MDQTLEPTTAEPATETSAAEPVGDPATAASSRGKPAPNGEPASTAAPGDAAPALDLDAVQARLAFGIIESLLNHTAVVHDLIALMAQVLDQDTVKALTATPQWLAYLDSKRALERTQTEIQEFTAVMRDLSSG